MCNELEKLPLTAILGGKNALKCTFSNFMAANILKNISS